MKRGGGGTQSYSFVTQDSQWVLDGLHPKSAVNRELGNFPKHIQRDGEGARFFLGGPTRYLGAGTSEATETPPRPLGKPEIDPGLGGLVAFTEKKGERLELRMHEEGPGPKGKDSEGRRRNWYVSKRSINSPGATEQSRKS